MYFAPPRPSFGRGRFVAINGRFLSQRLTGVQRYARELLKALDHNISERHPGNSVSWIIFAPPRTDLSTLDLKSIRLMTGGFGSGHLWEQVSLPFLARGALLLNLSNSGPISHPRSVTIIHDALIYRMPQYFSRPYRMLHQTLGRVLARTSTIATVSEFSRSELSDVLGIRSDRMTVVPNGCDHIGLAEPRRAVFDDLGVTPGGYFLFVGSPAPHKNLKTALAAFQAFGIGDFKLVLCGSANSAVFGSGMSELPDNVIQASNLSDGEISALYTSAAAFLFPSRYEGFGIPPLEAMVHGCPVLASDIPPCREVCGDAARYFAPDDVDGLAGLMHNVVASSGGRDVMIQKGYERQQHYRWASSAATMLNLVCSMT